MSCLFLFQEQLACFLWKKMKNMPKMENHHKTHQMEEVSLSRVRGKSQQGRPLPQENGGGSPALETVEELSFLAESRGCLSCLPAERHRRCR